MLSYIGLFNYTPPGNDLKENRNLNNALINYHSQGIITVTKECIFFDHPKEMPGQTKYLTRYRMKNYHTFVPVRKESMSMMIGWCTR